LTDFGEIRHGGANWLSRSHKTFQFPTFENQRWRTAAIFSMLMHWLLQVMRRLAMHALEMSCFPLIMHRFLQVPVVKKK